MTKANITQYDSTPSNNADINDINIAENCPASNINNAIRELMAHLKNVDTGSQALTALSVTGAITGGSLTGTALQILNGSNVNTASTDADDLIIEGPADCGLSILSATTGRIFFGDASDNDVGSIRYVHSDDSMRFEANGSEKLRLTSDGKVGIGTSSPASSLTVLGSSTTGSGIVDTLTLKNTGTVADDGAKIQFTAGTSTSGAGIGSGGQALNSADLRFFSGGNTERMRFNTSGTLLWASTVDVDSSNAGISFFNSTHPVINVSGGSDTAFRHRMTFVNGNGTVGIISTSGSSTTYSTSSDYRIKENVEDMTGAIDRVKQLSPKRFNFIADDTNTLVDGFLAHEAQSVVAEAVTGTHNEVDDNDNPVMQGIDQSKIVPLLTGALKEAIAKIEALETRVTALENA